MSLDQLCINTIRTLSIDAIQKANSGHPGLPMGAAAMAHTLWSRHLNYDPADPKWPNRDRFVLSGGHGSMLLYSMLHLAGFGLTLDDLRNFRQWGSPTAGHPEYGMAAGIEMTTGPLGQGFSTSVGMAMAEAHLAARYNTADCTVMDHFTYVLASDGDMMEGVACEAASLAGHLGLGKLICLYDSNDISLAGAASLSFTEDVGKRFEAYGWQVQTVTDGNDVDQIDLAITAAKAETSKPSLIVVRTIIGFGSPKKAGSASSHGSPLGKDEVSATKANLGWPTDREFYVPDEVAAFYSARASRGAELNAQWTADVAKWAAANGDLAAQWNTAITGNLPAGWDAAVPQFATTESPATRASGGKVLNSIATNYPALVGGSADLNPSTNTAIKDGGDFESPSLAGPVAGAVGGGWGYAGRNHHYGVREHAMAAAANGMALHGGLRPYVSTFFTFVDYLKPSLRLSALMDLPVLYVFTHDSIAVGEDGPTHQPIEHLSLLRATPNVLDLRPADANEVAECWKIAVENQAGPSALVLSRQNLPTFDRTVLGEAAGARHGAYVLKEASSGTAELILIGTGSEVSLAMDAAALLEADGLSVRVVSMPSWKLYDSQTPEYRASVLTPGVAKVAVEAAATIGWHKYVGGDGDVIGLDRFGASAPAERVAAELGFTPQAVADRARALIAR